MNLNRTELLDKIYGCWIGKSIGGTLGTPFEGRRELIDVQGFTSEPGKPLPNDDLDLQLIWLKALEERGPLGVNERILGEYWLNYIPPHWNEYGIGKANMKAGLLPPLSGNYDNVWKNSNGAWICSEIWACCTPGRPDLVTRYAYYDACIDHGTAEGTYAELFTATVESAAFVEKDPETLIQIGLSYLPKDCRVARSINIVLDGYHKGLDWKTVRQQVLDDSADLGWFQAPANVAYVVIGWLYGGGDFKKSLLIAVSCGDDTDCTGATLGSIFGIINGYKSIPEDWVAYVGDEIITVAVDRGSCPGLPATCTQLAERTLAMSSQVLAACNTGITISDEPTNLAGLEPSDLMAGEEHARWLASLDGSIVYDFIHTTVKVLYPSGPELDADGQAELKITLINNMPDPRHYNIEYIMPEGFSLVEAPRHISLMHQSAYTNIEKSFTVRLAAEYDAAARNHGVIQIIAEGRPTVILIPVLLYG